MEVECAFFYDDRYVDYVLILLCAEVELSQTRVNVVVARQTSQHASFSVAQQELGAPALHDGSQCVEGVWGRFCMLKVELTRGRGCTASLELGILLWTELQQEVVRTLAARRRYFVCDGVANLVSTFCS